MPSIKIHTLQLLFAVLIACLSSAGTVSAATNPVSCPVITTETFAIAPSDRTRRTIGVCEEVTLETTEAANWRLEAPPGSGVVNGKLVGTTENVTKVVFKAGELKLPAVVVAYIIRTKIECRVTFQIIPPTHLTLHEPNPIYHLANTTGGGFLANRLHAHPDTVSFYNIEIGEDTAVGSGTGVFIGGNGYPHTPGVPWAFQQTNNTVAGYTDTVYASAPQGSVGAGTFNWGIPLLYGSNTGAPSRGMGTIVQITVANSAGDALVSKGDLNVPVPLSTPQRLP